MTCQECKGTGQYVGLFKIEPCLNCNGLQNQQTIEKKSTMLVLQYGDYKGTKVWVLNPEELDVHNFSWCKAKFHRDNDLHAVEFSDETKEWWVNGKCHRDNDLPAVEFSNGTKSWWVNDKLHRDNDLPAVERSDGTKEWWVNGEFIK